MRIENGDKGYTRYRHAIWCALSPEQEVSDDGMIGSLIDFALEKSAKENREIVQIFCSSKVMDDMGRDPRKCWAVEFFLKA